MRKLLLLPVVALVLICTGCIKDDGTAPTPSGVSITFRTDSGYTGMDGIVAQSDTLHIRATITEGEDPLDTLYLSLVLDSGAATGMDTTAVDETPFVYETTHVTRAQAGTEQLVFTVRENDGDRTTRRLTFAVQ